MKRLVQYTLIPFLLSLVISLFVSTPLACTHDQRVAAVNAGIDCLKQQVSLELLDQVARGLASSEWITKLKDLGISKGEAVVACAAKQTLTVVLASLNQGAGSASTAEPSIIVQHAEAYLADKKFK